MHPRSPASRRRALGFLAGAAGLACLPALAARAPASPDSPVPMEVWKDPNCGCCQDWIAHMAQSGFAITVHDVGNSGARARLGLPERLGSCHTALVGGYVVEGHVPAADVKQLLQQKPRALGITVPGMPVGSPGMDGPEYAGRKDPYDVLLVTRNRMGSDVSTRVFSSYRTRAPARG